MKGPKQLINNELQFNSSKNSTLAHFWRYFLGRKSSFAFKVYFVTFPTRIKNINTFSKPDDKMLRLERQKHGWMFLSSSPNFPRQTVYFTFILLLFPSMCFSHANEGTTFCFYTSEGECNDGWMMMQCMFCAFKIADTK